jgi:HAD superfamily hydrolase (TIGR01509 family)
MARALVIFDCDGVLVDSEPLAMRVLLEAIAEAGLTLEAEVGYQRFLGRSLASITAMLEQEDGVALGPAALGRMRERLYAAFRAELKPIRGIAAALDGLGLPYCVASSSQLERVELSLRVTGLWPRFEGRAFSATMVAHGKPAPDLFWHAARTMGYPPEACTVVEDSPAGILAARAAGMRAVAFLGGSHATGAAHREAVREAGPDLVIEHMRELIGAVGA